MKKLIYKITNLINNKIYIGKTTRTLSRRFYEHISRALSNKSEVELAYLHYAIKKYGKENFVIEKLDTAETIAELNEKECYWISYYNSTDSAIGYNLTDGGDGGATCKNYSWWNDGAKNYYFPPDSIIPEGLTKGRLINFLDNSETIWINNGTIQKHIKISRLEEYPNWNIGMLDRGEAWHKAVTENLRKPEVILKAKEGQANFYKNNPHFTNSGSWVSGQAAHNKGKVAINNGLQNKYISKSDIDEWLNLGWSLGLKKIMR